jgi:cytoskeletal protein CcmA (bactofilin family)
MMRTRIVTFGLVVLSASFLGSGLRGAEFRHATGELVVKADETIDGDLYACGESVLIEGTVKGDLVAAARSVTVKGTVEGDLIAAGQTILVEGKVADDARIAGAILKLAGSGRVGGDLVAAGCGLECEPGSEVAGDARFFGGQALLAGKIGGGFEGKLGNCRLDGEVTKNVTAEVGGSQSLPPFDDYIVPAPAIKLPDVPAGMTVGQSARVGGKLSYWALREAKIDNPGAIAGGIEYHPPTEGAKQPQPVSQEGALAHLRSLAGVALFAFLAVLFMPRWTREMADNLRRRPIASFFCSFLGVIAFSAILALVVALTVAGTWAFGVAQLPTLAVATVFVGVFSTLALVGGYWFVVLFLAPAIVGTAIGRLLIRSSAVPTIVPFLIGVVVLAGLTWIPVVGVYLGGVVMLLGFGAYCVWLVAGAPPPPEVAPPARSGVAVKR